MLRYAGPIGHIAVADFGQARAFYEGVLGLEFVRNDGFAIVMRSGQIILRLSVPPEITPVSYSVFGWEVMEIETQVADLTGRGVVFERYGRLGGDQDEAGVWLTPHGDKVAWFKDPFGNLLSLSQHVDP
ncbi:glyoxalase/Bleomycin resistance protein/Dioxygenase superfamily protein [Asticcacaulis biprosthecium C19]|uniref:Glyoxalase/Bleomycin resistance protein/Dioxygenase superfamily protein n=1 Tax=Asticcacaulis biprosthecium C19 TaxID=715226 RepID=F4QR08_9CAUL|nr:VOC family protein [Asticcacaulis biprosthecium]EGF90645.1 glyoxalase/Bleomycin resistance protein/Dioxygenase superfamily protein [Asticcacaulis biprosthecium C19]